jgi:hypothetical protein
MVTDMSGGYVNLLRGGIAADINGFVEVVEGPNVALKDNMIVSQGHAVA